MAVVPYRAAVTTVTTGGQAVVAIFGGVTGACIVNPSNPADQNVNPIEPLYVDPTGAPAALTETATTFELQPGQAWFAPAGQLTSISVNAKTSGHKFSAYIVQPPTQFPPTPLPGPFPPSEPVSVMQTIPAYLYEEYADDDALQAFFASFNSIAQGYVDWFNGVPLAIYTNPAISGPLLDWVAQGVYGMIRPTLSSGQNKNVGPYNTWTFNSIAYDQHKTIGPSNVTATSDDLFKRIMTWNFWKGDGPVCNVRWLKRRIIRFLTGDGGSAPNVDQTYNVSVTFGVGNQVNINISVTVGKLTKSTAYDTWAFNTRAFDQATVIQVPGNHFPLEPQLKEAIDSGALQLPFQFTYVVTI